MKKYLMLARSNIRKRKKQTIVITVLILAASCMMNIWLILAGDYKANFDYQHKRLNSEHTTLVFNSDDQAIRDFVEETLNREKHVSEYRMDDVLFTNGSFSYNGGSISMNLIFMEEQTAFHRTIGKTELIEQKKSIESNGIYIPLLYTNDESFQIGKQFTTTIGNQNFSFDIVGYTNNIMSGSHNCVMLTLPIDQAQYQRLSSDPLLPKSTLVSVRTTDKAYGEAIETKLSEALTSQFPKLRIASNSYQLVSSSRYISQMICAAILSAMAFIVLLIVMIVIIANVITDIQENMPRLGILKAVGYQSRQIIYAYLLQFVLLAFIGSAIGGLISYSLFPTVNEMMISQTGIVYSIHFLAMPYFITIATITLIIAAAVYFAVKKIKRYEVIRALRQGIQTHSFQTNHLPLEKTRIPLVSALSLKTAATQKKQNIITCITTLMLTLTVAFTAVMLKNVIFDSQPMIDMIAGETADSCIGIDAENEAALKAFFKNDQRVEKSYLFFNDVLRHVNGMSLAVTVTDDFNDLNNQTVCVEGRLPRYENETAVAIKYARDNEIEIGDEIKYSSNGKEVSYIVSGFSQLSNNLGKDCFLTRSGYERMAEMSQMSYYLNLKDGTDIDAFNEEVRDTFREHVKESVNIDSVIEATAGVYVALMSFIVIIILALSALIVVLVMYLLVRTLLNHKCYDYGIMKALGFTARQLVFQTAMSFMPMLLISTIIGLAINAYLINPLAALFLSNIGIVKCMFQIPFDLIAVLGLLLVAFTFVLICILSMRIKRITPKALLSQE